EARRPPPAHAPPRSMKRVRRRLTTAARSRMRARLLHGVRDRAARARANGRLLVLRLVLVYVVVRVADALNLLGVLVRDFDAELLLEAHHKLDRVERVRAEVVNEARVRRDLVLVNAQLVNDDLLHFCFNLRIGHYSCSSSSKVGKLENFYSTANRRRRLVRSTATRRARRASP